MGVTLVCEYTKRSMDLGYIGFNRLRRKIAELAGEPFLSHYAKLDNLLFGTEKDFQAFDLVTARMFWTGEVSPHVIEFCMQSDCGGFVTWRACRKLLKIIGDYDDELAYGFFWGAFGFLRTLYPKLPSFLPASKYSPCI